MAVKIFANTIALPDWREEINAAVRAAMNNYHGNWQATILEIQGTGGLDIHITGPEGETWSKTFDGLEYEPSYIKRTIEQAKI